MRPDKSLWRRILAYDETRAVTDCIDNKSDVLVWGALGFLGQHLVQQLLERGANVSVLCRPRMLYPAPSWAQQVAWYELNGRNDEVTLRAAVASASIIYNLAGSSGAVASNLNPMESLQANCAAQLKFLSACEQAGNRPHVIFASSWLVYDIQESGAVSETHPVAPRSMYAAHKLCIESYLRIFQLRNKIDYTICRISNPYGCDPGKPTKGYKILNSFVNSALAGSPICLFGDGRQLRDFVYIADLTEGFLLCGRPLARNEVFNLSHGTSYSLEEAVRLIMEMAGQTTVKFEPWPAEYYAVEPGSYVADVEKARTLLGFQARTVLREGLEQTVRQFRANDSGRFAMRAGSPA